VIYTTDNGPHYNEWPDGGITPFRGEKNTNWEGAFRVPAAVRWPGRIPAGTVVNGIVSHKDWVPTLMAAAGEPDVKEELLSGYQAGDKSFRVHLDGFNMLPYFEGQAEQSPRDNFFYFSDDGELIGLRHERWKFVFAEQRAKQFMVWSNPFVTLRVPKLFDLRMDPFERADENSNNYQHWWIRHAFLLVPAQALVAQQLDSVREFPPRQKPASFNMEEVLGTLEEGRGG
jgi:arylsulfatase